MPSEFFSSEIDAWHIFIPKLVEYILITLFIISEIFLTAYAIWYISSLSAFLKHGFKKLGENPVVAGEHRSTCSWPRVAVIYPVFNDYEVLSTLDKALKLDYPDYFVIVVDDSTDEALVLELSKISFRNQNKLIHLRRYGRRGLKAGALNDAILLASKMGAKYVLILDADFEPPSWLLREMVAIAERTRAEVVQGHQRHVKGSDSLFGTIYRAGLAGSIIFMAGRMYLDMFPIFTGSVGLIKVSSLLRTPFREGSISEDLRWTIDRMLDTDGGLKIYVASWVYADGSVPKSFKAYWRQQLRWSNGTLLETLETWKPVLLSKSITLSKKAGYILQGFFYTQGLWIYIATLTPFIYTLLTGLSIPGTWFLGIYTWCIAIIIIILAGGIAEGYDWRRLIITAIAILPMIYINGFIYMYGSLKALLGRRAGWKVTSKRGLYERLYED